MLWIGQLISMIGTQMQLTALDWHIFKLLEGSTLTVSVFGVQINLQAEALGLGTSGLVRIIPIIFFALVGGVLADTRDRRKLMLWTPKRRCAAGGDSGAVDADG